MVKQGDIFKVSEHSSSSHSEVGGQPAAGGTPVSTRWDLNPGTHPVSAAGGTPGGTRRGINAGTRPAPPGPRGLVERGTASVARH